MNASFYTITALTNMHVGSGDQNYGIIDKLVQRDALTQYPCIHASSLKGAILQHFFNQTGVDDAYIDEVFGGQTTLNKRKSGTLRQEGLTGSFVFMQANILSIPMRSNSKPFYRVTSAKILEDLAQMLVDTGVKTSADNFIKSLESIAKLATTNNLILNEAKTKVKLEDKEFNLTDHKVDTLSALFENGTIILNESDFKVLSDNHHLPVIARNHLENGQSTNLWYEQILPRQTQFYTFILKPIVIKKATDFDTKLTGADNLVQIGANATVGYGYSQFEKKF